MDFHGIDAQGNLLLPRGAIFPVSDSGTIGRIFYYLTNNIIYEDVGDPTLNGNSISEGYPVGPLSYADHSSLAHPGTPLSAREGWIPLSTERHWHWANVVSYDNTVHPMLGENVQDAIDVFKSAYDIHDHPHNHDDRYSLLGHTHLNSQFLRISAMGTIQTMPNLLKTIAGVNGVANTIYAKTTSGTCNIRVFIDGSQIASFSVSSTGSTVVISQPFSTYSTFSVNVESPNGTDLMLAIKYQET